MKKTALRSAAILLVILTLILSLSACNTSIDEAPLVSEEPRGSDEPFETEDIIDKSEDIQETGCDHELMFGVCLHCKKDFSGSEGLFFISYGNGTCRLAGIGSCTDMDIVIPATSPDGDTVVEIGYRAFAWCETINSVTIPGSITLIQKSAFHDCLSLTGVTFEKPRGWTCNGQPTDVSSPSRNVGMLLNGDLWEKN